MDDSRISLIELFKRYTWHKNIYLDISTILILSLHADFCGSGEKNMTTRITFFIAKNRWLLLTFFPLGNFIKCGGYSTKGIPFIKFYTAKVMSTDITGDLWTISVSLLKFSAVFVVFTFKIIFSWCFLLMQSKQQSKQLHERRRLLMKSNIPIGSELFWLLIIVSKN